MNTMAIKTAKELAIAMLSELRNGAERSQAIYEELGKAAEDPQIKEALDARGMVASQILTRLDQCFKLIGEKNSSTVRLLALLGCTSFDSSHGMNVSHRWNRSLRALVYSHDTCGERAG
jgi:hypothetical protein